MSNADKIRIMTDEELADFIEGLSLHCLAGIGKVDCSGEETCDDCKVRIKEWLEE